MMPIRWRSVFPLLMLLLATLACDSGISQADYTPYLCFGFIGAFFFMMLPAAFLQAWLITEVWRRFLPHDDESPGRQHLTRQLFGLILGLAVVAGFIWMNVGFFSFQGMLVIVTAIAIAATVWWTRQIAYEGGFDKETTNRASLLAGGVTAIVPLSLAISCWTAVPVLAVGIGVAVRYMSVKFSLED